ncbi:hypothetical protein Cni_G19138 [Canna indica]|uniref:Reverse transcriptase domain-containing protein n=1 Tax=Canna indica TaxID=4628 RepID=A0AAQ3KK45_9LILI|nr:hypothetical protein Cni_G19138 [Canna indica]
MSISTTEHRQTCRRLLRVSIVSFMDAYSGYNQIRMHPEDEEKTTFISEHANFCYKINRNMEVYVDDMVAKTPATGDHYGHLIEIFSQLSCYNMRLNQEKCAFGVHGGKFLGFMPTNRGIGANLEKYRAIQEMRRPLELSEFSIENQPIGPIKAQVLADFVAEFTDQEGILNHVEKLDDVRRTTPPTKKEAEQASFWRMARKSL